MAGERYRDPSVSIPDRVADLLERMTLDEKLAQLACVWSTQLVVDDAFSADRARELMPSGTGHVTRIGASTGLLPEGSASFANDIQRFCVEQTRLGIPAIVHEESVAGLCARDATQFPQAIGLAATWDPDLIARMADVIRVQMRAVGARQTLAPVLDVARDPRWGRLEETYGSDPYLASRMGVAFVRGLQTDDLRDGVACTGKHFLAYGAPEGGRNHAAAHTGPRGLREVHAAPFAAAIHEAGLASVMNAYNEVDGLPCAGSREILTTLLRDELGFDGVVVADYFAVSLLVHYHHVAATPAEAARRALEAGLDVELPARECYGDPLRDLVERGEVAIDTVDGAVRRALSLKFALGLFEEPSVDTGRATAAYRTEGQRTLAREIAERSIVLLRDDDGLLPLDPRTSTVAVLGPCSDDERVLLGDYHYPAHLEIIYGSGGGGILPTAGGAFAPGPHFPPITTPLEAIREMVSAGTRVLWAQGCGITDDDTSGIPAAVDAARGADVAIVFVGDRSGLTERDTCGEMRDSALLALPGHQTELVEAVVATGTPTVVVLVSGRVHALPADLARCLVAAWIGGEAGGEALGRVLFGEAEPGGRLPVTIPRAAGQVPVHHAHKAGSGRAQMYGDYFDLQATPAYAFGHGLTYTTFDYGRLEIPGSVDTGSPFTVAVDVTNTGDRPGDEIVQLYLRDVVASVTRPVSQLAGFTRLRLDPAQTRRVTFTVDPTVLGFFDERMCFVVEPGEVHVMVGASSTDIRARADIQLNGPVREVTWANLRPTTVAVGADG